MMVDTQATTQLAGGMLQIASRRMAKKYPFHAYLLSSSPIQEDPTIGSMAVTLRQDQIVFLYDSTFVCSCTFAQLEGVLHHEINHILFDHLFADPQQYPDRPARIIAEEVTANEYVSEPLPGQPLLLAHYPQLPPNKDTHTRYLKLAKKRKKRAKKSPQRSKKTPAGRRNMGAKGQKLRSSSKKIQPLDNHAVWKEARAQPDLGRMVVRVRVKQSVGQLAPDQWDTLPPALKERIRTISWGNKPGHSTEDINPNTGHKPLHWSRVLQQYISRSIERTPLYHRPPRRFPHLAGIIPSQVIAPRKRIIMAVVDSSASIDTKTLAQISTELKQASRNQEVFVVECDTKIHTTYRYEGPLKNTRGRGGTDLRPPLDPLFYKDINPDVIIYFTDGFGPAPDKAPPVPVIWCLTTPGRKPVAWGRALRMNEA